MANQLSFDLKLDGRRSFSGGTQAIGQHLRIGMVYGRSGEGVPGVGP